MISIQTKKKFTSYKFHQFGFFFYLISLSPHLNRNAMLSFFLLFHVQQCYSLTTRKKFEKTLIKAAESHLGFVFLPYRSFSQILRKDKTSINQNLLVCSTYSAPPMLLLHFLLIPLYRSPLLTPLHFLFILSTSPLHPRHRSHPPHGSIPEKIKIIKNSQHLIIL